MLVQDPIPPPSQNTCVMYTPAHALVLTTPVLMHATLTVKDARAPVHARQCIVAETSLTWELLRTILSLVQAFFCFLPAAISTKSVARRCLLNKTIIGQIHASS